MTRNVWFVLEKDNRYYKLELGRTILNFTEFDFALFWETCISAGKSAYKTGSLPTDVMTSARNIAAGCHPYVSACLNSSFDSVALDCIIAYICSSEHIGLEELWARCISPKNNYEQSLFRRISEYKTGRASNSWVNIVRMHEYAKNKLDFVYDSTPEKRLSERDVELRRRYFDLAFSVAANESGYSGDDLPFSRRYSPSLLPGAAFRMGAVSKDLYRKMSDMLEDIPQAKSHNGILRDQNAMDVYSYIKKLERPTDGELRAMFAPAGLAPSETVYVPDGFKGMIDLEFELMSDEHIMIERCATCGRYFVRDPEYNRPYCTRMSAGGKTCREKDEENLRHQEQMAAMAKAAEKAAAEKAAADRSVADRSASEKAAPGQTASDDVRHVTIPSQIEKRAQRIYSALYRRIGKLMTGGEFREWSQYLSNFKRNVRNGDQTLAEYEEFLDYSENLYDNTIENARADYSTSRGSSEFVVNKLATSSEEEKPANMLDMLKKGVDSTTVRVKKLSEVSYSYPAEKSFDFDDTRAENVPVQKTYTTVSSNAPGKASGEPAFAERKQSHDYASPVSESYPEPLYSSGTAPAYEAAAIGGETKSAVSAVNEQQPSGTGSQKTEDGREFKPFMPKKYASVYEAMMDAQKPEDSEEKPAEKPQRIRKPDWEYLSGSRK